MHIPLTSRNEAWNSSINVIYYIQSVVHLYYTALRNNSSHISRNAKRQMLLLIIIKINCCINLFIHYIIWKECNTFISWSSFSSLKKKYLTFAWRSENNFFYELILEKTVNHILTTILPFFSNCHVIKQDRYKRRNLKKK